MTSPVSESRAAPADTDSTDFASLKLAPAVQRVLSDVGYETPSPIQAATIPSLLAGHDVLGEQNGVRFTYPWLNVRQYRQMVRNMGVRFN